MFVKTNLTARLIYSLNKHHRQQITGAKKMCILFVMLVPGAKEGKFKLIAATNRDEFFSRASEPAHFWMEDENILGGRDMTDNKEGGTWLAVSKLGKLGIVLNLSGAQNDPKKLGRGFLVNDYLKGSHPGARHLESLKNSAQNYNKFHLVLVDFKEEPVLSYYNNGTDSESVTTGREGGFAFGNSPAQKPYEKVKKGKARFEDIVGKYNDTGNKDRLVDELLQLLKWEEKHKNPNEEEMTHLPPHFRHECASVCINIPSAGYGTRTHTIILVDGCGKTNFYEWTLKEPIEASASDREWLFTHEEFDVGK